jgi:hypothetical protein
LPPPGTPALSTAPGAGPFAPYLCQPALADAGGKDWAFNLSGLYNPLADYVTVGAGNLSFAFQVCGQAATLCTPHYSVRFNSGPAVVAFPTTSHPLDPCYFTNGTVAPCSASDCAVPAWSTPVWGLLDPTNGATGGVSLTFQGTDVLADDPRQCPSDPVSGAVQPMQWELQIACDAAVPASQLKVATASEAAPCVFVVEASSAAACGLAA